MMVCVTKKYGMYEAEVAVSTCLALLRNASDSSTEPRAAVHHHPDARSLISYRATHRLFYALTRLDVPEHEPIR